MSTEGLPQNLEAERSVLGAIILDPAALSLVTPILREGDFFPDDHQRIYHAMLELARRVQPVDLLTLREQFSRSGGIEKAGGAAYLSSLTDGVPELANVEHYARIVKEKSERRRLVQTGQRLVREALTTDAPLDTIIAGASEGLSSFTAASSRDVVAAARVEESWRCLPTLAEVLSSMPPPGERFSTGIATLDRCSRGGFARGRVYTFVAPPSRGKTSFAVQLALRWAKERGAIVVGFFCDEGSWQAALMMAEGIGFDREDVEDRFAERRAEIEAATRELSVRFPSPDAPETVLDAVDDWIPDPEGRPVVVIVDSIQKVRCRKGQGATTPKERADALMETARLLSRGRLSPIILLTAKANRASWSSKNPADNIDPLAAGLDSSAIEYDSDALFFLDGDPEKGVQLLVAKNRPGDGTKPRISLGFDRARAQFREVDSIAAQDEKLAADEVRHAKAVERAQGRILDVLRRHPGISGGEIQRQVGGRRDVVSDARTGLDVQGAIEGKPGNRGALLWSLGSRKS